MTTKPVDPLAQIEHAQATLAKADAPLAQLEAAKLELTRVVASCDADLEELGSRRKIEMSSAMPAGELDKKLDAIEKREREVVRRNEIASIVLGQFEPRIVAGREDEAAARRQARYDQALALHAEATDLIRNFLGNVAPAARAALAAYSESEAATAAANRDLPPGAMRIPTIEAERLGSLPPAKITERRFQVFVSGRDLVAEVGKVEAHNVNGSWAVYRPSRSVQGDVVIPHCTIVDYVEATIQKYEPRPLEALSTSLRIPAFDAPAPGLGRAERRLMPASEWSSMDAQPDPLAVAAE
jgi:hypothetical protein